MKQRNEIYKQHGPRVTPAADAVTVRSYHRLLQAGFDTQTAFRLAMWHYEDDIKRQIEWIDRRNPTRNRLGMLRRAIEENWPEPPKPGSENPEAVLFASYFYAGYGGNDAEPVAQPSARDVAAADAYVQRLLEIQPDKAWVATWGRKFGAFASDNEAGSTIAIASLVVAIRRYGDAYLARYRAEQQTRLTSARAAARAAHQSAFTAQWFDYLRDCERRCRDEQPDEYAAFERARDQERERIRSSPWQLRREEALASFGSDERRLRAFQQWFRDHVLDFWQWDHQLNKQAA